MLESQDGKLSSNSAFSVICCQMMHRALGKHDQRRPLCQGADGIRDVSVLLGGRKSTQLCCTTRMWHAVISSIRGKHTNSGGVSPDRDFRSRGSALWHSAWCLVPSLCESAGSLGTGILDMAPRRGQGYRLPGKVKRGDRARASWQVLGAGRRRRTASIPQGHLLRHLVPHRFEPNRGRPGGRAAEVEPLGCLAGTSHRWKAGCVQGTYGHAVALDLDFLNQERVWRNEPCGGRAACGSPADPLTGMNMHEEGGPGNA